MSASGVVKVLQLCVISCESSMIHGLYSFSTVCIMFIITHVYDKVALLFMCIYALIRFSLCLGMWSDIHTRGTF